MSLRFKLLLGFTMPALMLLSAGIWSSYQMRTIGNRVEEMLSENERSIGYAVKMMEALERLDSGVLLKIQGDEESFQRILSVSSVEFKQNLENAFGNITIPGEKEILDSLRYYSDRFFAVINEFQDNLALETYRMRMFPLFENTQQQISDLRYLNSQALYSVSREVIDRTNRAALPADLIILSAIVFMILFAWLTQAFIVNPLRRVLKAVTKWRKEGEFKPPELESDDELKALIQELSALSASRIARPER